MPLDSERLEGIIDDATNTITKKICMANQNGTLRELLSSLGLENLLNLNSYGIQNDPQGTIIVLGAIEGRMEKFYGVISSMGLDKKRFKFLDYDEAHRIDCRTWKHNSSVAVILVGPIPHKTTGMGDYSSLLECLKSEEGYPPIEELRASDKLKITKTNFENTLKTLLHNGNLRV